VLQTGALLILPQSPAREASSPGVTLCEEGYLVLEHLAPNRRSGTRADEAHVATEYVKQLRQFIEPSLANNFANASDALVVSGRPLGTVLFRILTHRA